MSLRDTVQMAIFDAEARLAAAVELQIASEMKERRAAGHSVAALATFEADRRAQLEQWKAATVRDIASSVGRMLGEPEAPALLQ